MAQWTKNSITKPLLRSTSKIYNKDSIECFKKIQMIMGDRPRRSHGRTNNNDDVADIQSILTLGITGGQSICDEIYVQLCKQLNHNPGSTSSQNGWELLSVLCSTIPPSNDLALYIIQLLRDHHDPRTIDNTSNDKSSLPFISSYLSLKIRRICQKGAHGKVPSQKEIQLDRMAISQQQRQQQLQKTDKKANNQVISTMVFGTSLDIIMENQQHLDDIATTTAQQRQRLKIPRIVPFLIRAIRQLDGHSTQGIFRIAGHADLVTSLRLQIENGFYYGDDEGDSDGLDLDVCCGDPNVPASLLRLWLRELPTPLIPVDYYDRCIDLSNDLVAVMMIVDSLPNVNRRILMYIIGFLQEYLPPHVCERTLMTVNNLAMVFAPNLLRGPLTDNLVLALHKSKYEQLFVKTLLLGPKVDMDHQLYD
ncbi:Rho GTPase activation protein [Chlamydoabsidia padenii]|nr:Rho GTPase activation protein [Chlamydoabsidia padenii]